MDTTLYVPVIDALERAPSLVVPLVREVPEAVRKRRPAPAKWSARFQQDRARLVSRLRTLAPADWDRTAEHGEYSRYSVFIMFRHVAMHDHLHSYRIEELLLKKDWPSP